MPSPSNEEFKAWATYIYDICGVHLDPSKAYLLDNRLQPLMKSTNSATFSELFYKVKGDPSKKLQMSVINSITTRETSFFRDTAPFEMLKYKILPELIDRRSKMKTPRGTIPIRIWSAACSHGQEVYSTLIAMHELLGSFSGYEISVVGSDISDDAIVKASQGIYSKLEIERGLPPNLLSKYFVVHPNGWKIRDDIRGCVTYKAMNLLQPFIFPAKFDIIFCRNVAIYFTEPDKKSLFERLANTLSNDGYLIIGSTETLLGIVNRFTAQRHLRSVFYTLV